MSASTETAAEPARPPSVRQLDSESLKYARWQSAAWAIMFGAGENTLSLLGAFLKAPSLFFGLMSAIPQLVGPLTQIFAAGLMDRWPHRRTMVLIGVLGQSVAFVPLALIAFLSPEGATHWILLSVLTLYFIAGHFSGPPWTSLISDLVPSSRRGVIFSQFGRISATLTLASMLATAAVLWYSNKYDAEHKAWYFAGVFLVAGLARFVGFLLIARMEEPVFEPKPASAFTFWQFIRRARESNFVKFVLFAAFMNGSANISGPYFLPYCRYDLKFADWQWLVISSSGTLATILALLFWGKFADRFGNKRTIAYSSLLIAIQPLNWLLSDNFYFLIGINSMAGVAWGGFNLAAGNYILEACSPPVRARCVAYYSMMIGAFVFMGSMLGGYLLKVLPRHLEIGGWQHDFSSTFMYLLWFSSIGRALTALVFIPHFKELRDVHSFSLKEWFFENVQTRIAGGIRVLPFAGNDKDD
ncbi:MAG TPA: MFS transporter [Planctomycetota bacterium]|nr:MFS transporter [Planctomycetota bacterium]